MTDQDFALLLERTASAVAPMDLVAGALARSQQRKRRRLIGSTVAVSGLVAAAIAAGVVVNGSSGAQRLLSRPGTSGDATMSVTPRYLPAGARLVDHRVAPSTDGSQPVVTNDYGLPDLSNPPPSHSAESPSLLVAFNPNRHNLKPPKDGLGFHWTLAGVASNVAYIGTARQVEEPVTEIVWLDPAGFHGVIAKQPRALGSSLASQRSTLIRIATSLYPPGDTATTPPRLSSSVAAPPVNHTRIGSGARGRYRSSRREPMKPWRTSY